MEYIHLVGVEQIQSAANEMHRAAETISNALSKHEDNICAALDIHGQIMIEVMKELNRLEIEGMKYDRKPKNN